MRPFAVVLKKAHEILPGDRLVMTDRVFWTVRATLAYVGAIDDMPCGSFVAETNCGPITLPGDETHEVMA